MLWFPIQSSKNKRKKEVSTIVPHVLPTGLSCWLVLSCPRRRCLHMCNHSTCEMINWIHGLKIWLWTVVDSARIWSISIPFYGPDSESGSFEGQTIEKLMMVHHGTHIYKPIKISGPILHGLEQNFTPVCRVVTVHLTVCFGKIINRIIFYGFQFLKTVTVS